MELEIWSDIACPWCYVGKRRMEAALSRFEQARAMERQLVDVAAVEGLDFRFDIARGGTTFDGHRIVHLALERDRQDP